MLEIKPYFSKKNLIQLINQTKKLKFFSITSFNEKNIKNLSLLKKKINLGLCFASTTPIERIIRKKAPNTIDTNEKVRVDLPNTLQEAINTAKLNHYL